MRVIGGNYRGRKLECPEGNDIRPTTDRVKENIFNILAPRMPYSKFLDLFSGSGGIGIEAISRSANEVVFVDGSTESINALKNNLQLLKLEEGFKILHNDVFDALDGFENTKKFDIIFMDPPYNKGVYQKVLEKISELHILEADGIIAVERHVEDLYENLPKNIELVKERKYGSIVLSFFQIISE